MPFIGETSIRTGAAGAGGFSGNVIDDSVIFNRPDADFTEWTPAATPTSLRAGSCFFWVKLDTVDTTDADTSARHIIMAGTDPYGDRIYFGNQAVASKEYRLTVSLLGNNWYSLDDFRDFTGWSAFYVKWDVDNGTASERLRAWVVDGTSIREITWENSPAITGADCDFNDTQNHHLGSRSDTSGRPFSGYLGQFALIDGTGSTAITDFIEQDTNGNYGPKSDAEIQALTFGNHGVFFKDGTDIQAGTDTSGNSMSITTTNGPAASAVVSDSPTNSEDGVSGNYCTWNPTENSSKTNMSLQDGNLVANGFDSAQRGTLFVSSGKWYAELTISAAMSCYFGISEDTANMNGDPSLDNLDGYLYYSFNGQKIDQAGSGSSYGSSWNTAGKTVGVAVDMDNGAIWFSVDGVWQNSATISEIENGTTTNAAFTSISGNFALVYKNGTNGLGTLNTGQSSFSYTPPTGFNAINSKTIADALAPTITDPSLHFTTVTVTGTGAEQAVTGVGFQPDMLWIKRTTAVEWAIYDSVRGATKEWNFDATNAESTVAQGVKSFDADGFTLGTDASVNALGGTYVVYCFKFDNSSGASNSDGTITTTVAVNADAKMSCGTFSGNATGGATIGHGLGVTPAVVIVKRLDSTGSPQVYHRDLGATKALEMDAAAVPVTSSTRWNDTAPSSTVITLGSSNATNASGADNMVFYAFADVEGFFASGLYEGNANADGPFVWAGHRPNVIWSKSIDNAESYYLSAGDAYLDYNPMDAFFIPDLDFAVQTSNAIDILATGFKMKTSNSVTNSSHTRVWFSLAKSPFTGTTSAYQQSRAR